MLKSLLNERNIPQFKSKEEMLDIIQREEYGYIPKKPDDVTYSINDNYIHNFCAGKALGRRVEATYKIDGREFTFPFYVSIPKKEGKHPFFVSINFRDNVPDRFLPVEEIIDNCFAVISFCYQDVTKDNDDFTDGLAGLLYKDGKRGESDAGKIAMWAWAAQRVMDYAQTLDSLDLENAVVCGHSRLGKTALLAGATDERFKFAFSNDSGCCGAAITRGKGGENIDKICERFPFWFCENLKKYRNKEEEMPFDQHYLAACVAPRCVYVASAKDDLWADPVSEFLNCVAISEVYEKQGLKGLVSPDRLPQTGEVFHEGNVGYHMREGLHYFGREDWNKAMDFVRKHM